MPPPTDPGQPPQRPGPPDYSDAPRCEHPHSAVRRLTQANGVVVARRQCSTCGDNLGVVKKGEVPNLAALPVFDEPLRTAWQERCRRYYSDRREAYEEALRTHDARWWAWYDAYLRTPRWSRLRDKVLARDGHLCQGCRESPATQVHHLTYDRVGREMLFDLVAVCERCHSRIHPDKR